MSRNLDRVLAIKRKMSEVSEIFLTELYAKWESMFVVTDQLSQQGEDVIITHLQEFFQEILSSEEERKTNLVQRVQDKLRECHELQTILSLPRIELDSEKPLSLLLDELKSTLDEIEVLKQERLQQMENLRAREAALCTALTLDPVVINNPIPSEGDLELVDLHIFQMEEEKVKRFEAYTKFRKEIGELIASLEVSVLDEWEQELVSGEDSEFPLTADSMALLEETRERYLKDAEANRMAINKLTDKLKKLWSRMNVSQAEQEEFLAPLQGIGNSVKARLISEIQICQEKRRDMLLPLISRVREEISSLCDELTYTDERKNEALMLDRDVSEELLDILENKCDWLRATLDMHQDMLATIKKRATLWERAFKLELASRDQNRLFTNRGGQLLKEEKERKAIDITLPKVHRELVQMLIQYQENEESPFLYYGENLLEKITTEWENRVNEKENLRCKKKDQPKRKRDGPQSASKRAKVDNQDSSIIASSNFASNRTTSSTRSQRSKGNANSSNKTIFTPTVFTYEGMSTSMSYSKFQEDITVSAGVGNLPVAHSSPTDRRGTFTINQSSALPKTPVSVGRNLRSARTPKSGIPRQKTPVRPILRSAAAATLAAPARPQTPGTPRARPCALTLPRTPSAFRQNNMFI